MLPNRVRGVLRKAAPQLFDRKELALRRHNTAFFAPLVPRNGLAFDVGAHLGAYTSLFLRLGARVVAVEPNPALAEDLRKRFRGQPVVVEEIAVGDAPGTATLRIGSDNSMSTISPEWAARSSRWVEDVDVPVTTLEGLIERHGEPDFLKVDVEGNDLRALQGLRRAPPALSFEFQARLPRADTRRCLELVSALGDFSFNLTVEEIARWWPIHLRFEDWVGAEEVLETIDRLRAEKATTWGNVYARRF